MYSAGRPRPLHQKVITTPDESLVCSQAQELRGILSLNFPIENGVITNFDEQEMIWDYMYKEGLKISRKEHPVLITEPPMNPISQRKEILQIFFEKFEVPAMYFAIPGVLSLYASGEVTGCVLDVGDTVTHAISLYEGYTMPHTTQRTDIAGRKVTNYFQKLLRESGYGFYSSSEREIVREMKETRKLLSVAQVTNIEQRKIVEEKSYPLPDGSKINLKEERFFAPEVLFKPYLIGSEQPGAVDVLNNCIQSCDIDIRERMFKKILLAGGTTLLDQFPKRVLYELKEINPKINIGVFAPPERKYTSWIGGSILADLSSFRSMWIDYRTYSEKGLDCIDRNFQH